MYLSLTLEENLQVLEMVGDKYNDRQLISIEFSGDCRCINENEQGPSIIGKGKQLMTPLTEHFHQPNILEMLTKIPTI